MHDIQIALGSSLPIYRQIMDQIRRAARLGKLLPGDSLPSVRTLAEKLLINPNTVARAYAELTREGTIESIQGKGYFLASKRSVYSLAERRRRLNQALEVFIHEALGLDLDAQEIQQALEKKLTALQTGKERVKGEKNE